MKYFVSNRTLTILLNALNVYFRCIETHNMPDNASRTLFSGGEVLHPNDLGNAEVANFGNNIDNRLREHYKWKGQALGTIGLTLSSDNECVIGGLFITRGATKFKEPHLAGEHTEHYFSFIRAKPRYLQFRCRGPLVRNRAISKRSAFVSWRGRLRCAGGRAA